MNVHVKIKFNPLAIQQSRQTRFDTVVLPELSALVLNDSNRYCRMQSGRLMASSYIASQLQQGLLVWNTPYAAKVYFTGNPRRNVNPFASLMWFEQAKGERGNQWNEFADRRMKR